MKALVVMLFLDSALKMLHFYPIDHIKILDITFKTYREKKSIFFFGVKIEKNE